MRCAHCTEPLLRGLEDLATVFCDESCRDEYKAAHWPLDLETLVDE